MDEASVELRGLTTRQIADVLDAVALARGVSRIELVNSILEKWRAEVVHEASLICRITRGNGCCPESSGNHKE